MASQAQAKTERWRKLKKMSENQVHFKLKMMKVNYYYFQDGKSSQGNGIKMPLNIIILNKCTDNTLKQAGLLTAVIIFISLEKRSKVRILVTIITITPNVEMRSFVCHSYTTNFARAVNYCISPRKLREILLDETCSWQTSTLCFGG